MRAYRPAEGIFALPGGLALEDGRRLGAAELRPLTGREEELLAQQAGAPSAVVVTQLLSACLTRLDGAPASPELVRRLLVGDRDYLVLQLRRMTLGDAICAVFVCPGCGGRMDVDFQAEDIPIEWRPQKAASYTLDLDGQGEARSIRFRLPTGADQESVLGMDIDQAVDAILARCLLDDGGAPLASEERAAVIDAMERLAPQVELELDLTCPECGHAFVAPFDTTTFFFSEMRINGDQLLREVHVLALYYHWSEADILGLTRARRRAYLGLLSEALRRE